MVNSVFQIHYVSAQNCFIYLPQTSFRNVIKSDFKTKVYSLQRFDSIDSTPIAYFSAQLSSSLPDGFVGLNAMYAELLNIPEKLTVCVSEVARTTSVAKVFLTPVSEDDFDILETCANSVEEHLLSQLRIVWPNQLFPVWISKSLSVRLKVESIEPNSEVGCLEQFSELIINCMDTVKTQNSINYHPNEADEPTKFPESPPSALKCPSNFFKDYFKEEICRLLTKERVSSLRKVKKSFLFRVHSCSSLKFHHTSPPIVQPFNVFVFRKHLPKLWALRHKPLYCKVTKAELVLSNDAAKNEIKNEVPENVSEPNAKLPGSFEGVVYIALNIIEDMDQLVVDHRDIPHHKCVYASSELMEMLQLSVSDRVKLEIIEIDSCVNEPTMVYISTSETSENKNQETELQEETRSFLQNCLEQNGGLLLLNQTSMVSIPFQNSSIKIMLTINSDKSKYFLLSKESLRYISFQVTNSNSIKFDSSPEQDVDSLALNLEALYDMHLEEILSKGKKLLPLSLQLAGPAVFHVFQVSNFLITGGPGSGRTTVAKLLCRDLVSVPYFVYCKYLSCKMLKGKTLDKVEKALKQCLIECVYHEPAILFLDDIDMICNAIFFNHDNYPEFLHCNKVSKTFKDLVSQVQSKFSVTVIATASSSVQLNEEIMPVHKPPVFNVVFEIPELTKDNRVQILTSLLPKNMFKCDCEIDFETLATKTENYVIQDFSDLCRKIKFVAWKEVSVKKLDHFISDRVVQKAVESIVPLGLRGVSLKKDVGVSWESIGGMERIKQALTEYLIWPSKYPEIFSQNPSKNHSGILLYGMPGTGKTMIASSLVSECQVNFISIKGPELLSKFIGASEEGVRNIFKKAESAKPCILFFDEFDSLAPRRGQDNTGVTDRVVNQLLTQLDGVESLNGVTVVAATSRPDLIDPALLRPGRLHHLIHCPVPDEHDRLQILEKLSSALPLASDINLSAVAKFSENFTGADLRGLLYTAQINAIDESNSEDQTTSPTYDLSQGTKTEATITQKHLLAALENTTPSVSSKERQKYQNIYKRFTSSRTDKDKSTQEKIPQKVILA